MRSFEPSALQNVTFVQTTIVSKLLKVKNRKLSCAQNYKKSLKDIFLFVFNAELVLLGGSDLHALKQLHDFKTTLVIWLKNRSDESVVGGSDLQ